MTTNYDYAIQSGGNQTAIGYNALTSLGNMLTSGTQNTAIGYNAITTGGNNTTYGYNAHTSPTGVGSWHHKFPPSIDIGNDDVEYTHIKLGKIDVIALNDKVQEMEKLITMQTDVIKALTEKLEELYYAPGQPGFIKAQVSFKQTKDAFVEVNSEDEEISDVDE